MLSAHLHPRSDLTRVFDLDPARGSVLVVRQMPMTSMSEAAQAGTVSESGAGAGSGGVGERATGGAAQVGAKRAARRRRAVSARAAKEDEALGHRGTRQRLPVGLDAKSDGELGQPCRGAQLHSSASARSGCRGAGLSSAQKAEAARSATELAEGYRVRADNPIRAPWPAL